jgi:phospholipase D1/2
MTDHADRILRPGDTCWRTARAERFGRIVDGADYLANVKSAMLRARHRIMLIGWDFDYRTAFEADKGSLPGPNHLGPFLHWLIWRRPDLQVYLLKSNLRLLPAFDGFWFGIAPVSLLNQITSRRMHFEVDGAHPPGAVHHQKIVVVDDTVAFCGGIDLTLGRWDTRRHLGEDPRRKGAGQPYGPRHEVAAVCDGDAARALAEQARERWHAATREGLEPITTRRAIWPPAVVKPLRDVDVGIVRTLPALPQRAEVREVEALNLAAVAAAKHVIYLENQYLAARSLAEALAERLKEPDGPEVVIVLPRSSESRLEQQSMDSARQRLLGLLWDADAHGRLGVYWPVAAGGTPVYVHSKVLVIDDRLLRIGSSNLNNRSLGFDSECDLALEAVPDTGDHSTVAGEIAYARDDLLAEHLGTSAETLRAEIVRCASVLAAVDSLRTTGRSLRKFTPTMTSADAGPFAENDLMDPSSVPESVAQGVFTLITGAVLWPLTRLAPQAVSTIRSLADAAAALQSVAESLRDDPDQ